MGLMDKVKGLLGQHPDQAKTAVEKTGDAVDEKTGDRYSSQVDTAEAKADEYIDKPPEQG